MDIINQNPNEGTLVHDGVQINWVSSPTEGVTLRIGYQGDSIQYQSIIPVVLWENNDLRQDLLEHEFDTFTLLHPRSTDDENTSDRESQEYSHISSAPIDITDESSPSETYSDNEDTPSIYIDEDFTATVAIEPTEESEPDNLDLDSVSMRDATSRFRGAAWASEINNRGIAIAGLGGIGSWTALNIARLDPKYITLIDPDHVEAANLSGQLYSSSNVNEYKALAMRGIIASYCDYWRTTTVTSRIQDISGYPITICGFDNMEARCCAFEKWCDRYEYFKHIYPNEPDTNFLFIDGRLTMDYLQVFCIPGNDIARVNYYREHDLFDSSEAEHTICSMKQTSFMACMISSVITNLLVNWISNIVSGTEICDLPYCTQYDSNGMFFTTDNSI